MNLLVNETPETGDRIFRRDLDIDEANVDAFDSDDVYTEASEEGLLVNLLLRTTEPGEGHARRLLQLGRSMAARLFSCHPEALFRVRVFSSQNDESLTLNVYRDALDMASAVNGGYAAGGALVDNSILKMIERQSKCEYMGILKTLRTLLAQEQKQTPNKATYEILQPGSSRATHFFVFEGENENVRSANIKF